MKYLIVSGSLLDAGGLAMIKGAMNGIKCLDEKAKFRSLQRKVHFKKVYVRLIRNLPRTKELLNGQM